MSDQPVNTPSPLSPEERSKRWLFWLLTIVVCAMGLWTYVVLRNHSARYWGGLVLAIGAYNIIFRRRMVRGMFRDGIFNASRFWATGGERATAGLFLGIGIVFALAGCAMIAFGS
jgi:hypothetical protein